MNRLRFAIVLHFHQPVGNLEEVFERAYRCCYRPFLEFLSNYPDICITAHFSGCLMDYLEQKHPDIIELLKILSSRGQMELLGGPYYEPILTAIPRRDALSQIHLMSEYIKERFGLTPQGSWIPERVWEQNVAGLLSGAGMRYCLLDDTLLMKTRIGKEDISGYFMTGEEKRKIAVFPFDKKLRYLIPFKLPQKAISYMKEVTSKKEGFLLTYADDGEKFGEWPGTFDWVYRKGWLKDFFEALRANRDWLELTKLSDYMSANKPVAEMDIPEGSYDEMTEWAEGSWKNFLSRYPEANQMHRKALYVSSKIDHLKKAAGQKPSKELEAAARELYKGQCNCSYWHGFYGGLYFYHLRRAIYQRLITAEKMADDIALNGGKKSAEVKRVTFEPGDEKEFLIESESFSLYFDPQDGGVLRELDHKPSASNFINTLSRKKEPYHKVSHPVDKHPRYCLRDHFLSEKLKKAFFIKGVYDELGDFAAGGYSGSKKGGRLTLERVSKVAGIDLKVIKEIDVRNDKEILISYTLEKASAGPLGAVFAVEFNVTMPLLNAYRYYYACGGERLAGLNSTGTAADVASFGISDGDSDLALALRFSKKARQVWYFPVKTISQSEKKYGRNYQASCILPRWKPDFTGIKKWHLEIMWSII